MNDEFLVMGLGNPGPTYAKTRHNIGFISVEAMAKAHGLSGKSDRKMETIIYRGSIAGKKVILAQPLTYMNLSGRSYVQLTRFYKIPPEQTLVILDDSAIPFGKIRFRPEGSSGSHNGMKSILELAGTQSIPRLRIGIGSPSSEDMVQFVLSSFTREEELLLPKIITISAKAIETWFTSGIESAMNLYNGINILEEPVSS